MARGRALFRELAGSRFPPAPRTDFTGIPRLSRYLVALEWLNSLGYQYFSTLLNWRRAFILDRASNTLLSLMYCNSTQIHFRSVKFAGILEIIKDCQRKSEVVERAAAFPLPVARDTRLRRFPLNLAAGWRHEGIRSETLYICTRSNVSK